MTEDIYQNLVVNLDKNAPESIHLCSYPAYNEDYIDKELEENMNEVLESSSWDAPAGTPPISRTASLSGRCM